MIKTLALLTLIIFSSFCFSTHSYGQKKFDLTYDSAGRLIEFPSAVARGRREVCPKLVIPAATIYREVNKYVELLEAARDYLEKGDNYSNYYCFFQTTPKKFDFVSYVSELETEISDLKSLQLTTLTDKTAIDSKYASQLYLPTALYLTNLFTDHFLIRVRVGTSTVGTIPLNKVHFKNNCFYFEGECTRINKMICDNCGYKKAAELSYDLMSADPLNTTIKQWFEKRNEDLETLTPEDIRNNLETMASAPDPADDSFKTAYNLKAEIGDWFPYWFWYSGGKFVIDPFAVVDQRGVEVIKDEIKEYDRDIQKLTTQKKFIDSVIANIDYSFRKFQLFKKVQSVQTDLADKITEKAKLKKADEKKLATNSDKLLFLQTKVFLNNTRVVVSDFKHVRPQFEFDAADGYFTTADTKRSLHRVLEIPDNEQEYIVVHNVDSATVLKFDHQPANFKDVEDFTEQVTNLFTQINSVDVTNKQVSDVESFLKTFARTTAPSGAVPTVATITCLSPSRKFENPVFKDILAMAKDFHDNKRTVFYEKSIFEENDPASPLYRTQIERVRLKGNAPFADSIPVTKVVSGKESQAFNTKVNVGKLNYVSVVLGIAINQNPIQTTTIDTSSNGFKATTTDNKARAVAGIKLYPFQYYKRDGWLLPRYPLHRISIFGGFELLHPLNNFYLGGGYDIIPGLGISIGKNFYLQTNYKIENGTVTDTFRSYHENKGVYYSVNVNPILFAQSVKFFFKNLL